MADGINVCAECGLPIIVCNMIVRSRLAGKSLEAGDIDGARDLLESVREDDEGWQKNYKLWRDKVEDAGLISDG